MSITNQSPDSKLVIDADEFSAYFDRYPFKLVHRLAQHPLLQLPRLVQLAHDRGGEALYFRGDHRINQVDDDAPATNRTFIEKKLARPALSATETIAQIAACSAWLQLRDVGTDREYAQLLAEIIDEFRPHAESVAPGLDSARADIFVSSPRATTPFHLDEEHNFLLQIRGSKQLSICDGFDPDVVSRETLRDFFRGNGELARHTARLEEHAVHVTLQAGEGVHIPPCHPHWVQNGAEVSISLGILWLSDVTARRRHLYRVNGWLERLGLQPAQPGEHPKLDALKAWPATLKRRARRALQARTNRAPLLGSRRAGWKNQEDQRGVLVQRGS
jgi:hypothetical protein